MSDVMQWLEEFANKHEVIRLPLASVNHTQEPSDPVVKGNKPKMTAEKESPRG